MTRFEYIKHNIIAGIIIVAVLLLTSFIAGCYSTMPITSTMLTNPGVYIYAPNYDDLPEKSHIVKSYYRLAYMQPNGERLISTWHNSIDELNDYVDTKEFERAFDLEYYGGLENMNNAFYIETYNQMSVSKESIRKYAKDRRDYPRPLWDTYRVKVRGSGGVRGDYTIKVSRPRQRLPYY